MKRSGLIRQALESFISAGSCSRCGGPTTAGRALCVRCDCRVRPRFLVILLGATALLVVIGIALFRLVAS